MNEQIIKAKAYMIYADMQHQIKPRSNQAARQWLRLAFRYAITNHHESLAEQIRGYLNASELKTGITTLALSAA